MIDTIHRILNSLLLAALLVSCAVAEQPILSPTAGPTASQVPATPVPPTELVLMTHDSFAISESVLATFQRETGATVRVLTAGDAGSMVNQAILTRESPLADVLYGVDNTFLSRALDANIFEPYRSRLEDNVPPQLDPDDRERVAPIDYGDVCVNYDRAAFDSALAAPTNLEQLTEPAYRSMLVVENPATSSPGLVFMLATIARFGDEGDYTWLDYWADLRDNDVLAVSGWELAYNQHFSGGPGAGDRPLVVSYATSPVAEVYFAEPQPEEAPTAVMTDGCFRQVEYAGVLAGANAPQLARDFIDFMLSPEFQSDVPLNMFVFPASTQADVPPVFIEHAAHVAEPLTMEPGRIAANRERWLQEWTDAILR
jgi:thiamine transport system substrate-binding protein